MKKYKEKQNSELTTKLIKKFQKGDNEVFNELIKSHQNYVYRYVKCVQ